MNPVILYDNRLNDGTPTATDTAADTDVLNLRDLRTYTWWQAASSGTKYLTIDCGSAKRADALGIIGHNLGTAAATVSVESSATGAWAGEEVERLAGFAPSDDRAILKLFTSASARYWRIKIVTAAVAPKLAVCLLGERLTFPYPPEVPFVPFTEDVEEESSRSKAGHLLGTVIRYKPIRIAPRFAVLTRDWVFGEFQTFWDDHASERKPFFWAWDLDNMPALIFLVRHAGRFAPPLSRLAYVDSLALDLEGVKES